MNVRRMMLFGGVFAGLLRADSLISDSSRKGPEMIVDSPGPGTVVMRPWQAVHVKILRHTTDPVRASFLMLMKSEVSHLSYYVAYLT
jgi:hypothetical protein